MRNRKYEKVGIVPFSFHHFLLGNRSSIYWNHNLKSSQDQSFAQPINFPIDPRRFAKSCTIFL